MPRPQCVNTTVTLLHVSALKGPTSGSTDALCVQGQQNMCPDVSIRLNSSTHVCYMAVVAVTTAM